MTIPTQLELDTLRLDLSVNTKNGSNFVVAAALMWLAVTCVWTLPYSLKNKAIAPNGRLATLASSGAYASAVMDVSS